MVLKRCVVNVESDQRAQIEVLRKRAEKAAGVPVSLAAMVRKLLAEGLKRAK